MEHGRLADVVRVFAGEHSLFFAVESRGRHDGCAAAFARLPHFRCAAAARRAALLGRRATAEGATARLACRFDVFFVDPLAHGVIFGFVRHFLVLCSHQAVAAELAVDFVIPTKALGEMNDLNAGMKARGSLQGNQSGVGYQQSSEKPRQRAGQDRTGAARPAVCKRHGCKRAARTAD